MQNNMLSLAAYRRTKASGVSEGRKNSEGMN
jgi:hypothetical protein